MKRTWQVAVSVGVTFILLTSSLLPRTIQASSSYWTATLHYYQHLDEVRMTLTYTGPETTLHSFSYSLDYNQSGIGQLLPLSLEDSYTYHTTIRLDDQLLQLPAVATVKWNNRIETIAFHRGN